MTTAIRCHTVAELMRRLDDATRSRDDEVVVREVKQVLVDTLSGGALQLDPAFLVPAPDKYARRLLHRDPRGRYTALVMVWDVGQGTRLHDHGGHWCVEGVYRGQIEVVSYSVRGGDPEQGIVQFAEETTVRAGVGQAGALIPPFEYHLLRNAGTTPAVTIHVYSEELTSCHVFDPVDGGWRRRHVELSYTE